MVNNKQRTKNIKQVFRRLAMGVFAALLGFGATQAAPLTTGADFLLMTTGARPDGMGQAFSAVADDINTLSFNPAGLANIRLPEVGYGHESYAADISYDFIGAAVPLGPIGVLGFGYLGMGTPAFNSTADPLSPTVSVFDRALTGGWGISFYDLQVGAAAKVINRQLDNVQGSGFGFDLGLRYRPVPYLALAASVLNMGPGISLAGLEPLPTVLNTGVAWAAIEDSTSTLNLTANAAFHLNTDAQQLGVGAEYWFKDAFALRAGYLAHSFDATLTQDGFSAGAGVKVSFFQLDYAYKPFNTLGPIHRISGIFRWEGPWFSGGEPNPPKYVNARQTLKALEIRWEKPQGPAQAYEVTLQPLDGRGSVIFRPVVNPICLFESYEPNKIYKITVKTMGGGGALSTPSKETYCSTGSVKESIRNYYRDKAGLAENPSESRGVLGEVDAVGLKLSWEAPASGPAGYNLYSRAQGGRVEKINAEPKHGNRLWLTDVSGYEGCEWIVTALGKDGRETVVGSYLWYPSPAEMDALFEPQTMRLHAAAEPDQRLFLDWDRDPEAESYVLLSSGKPDNVYEYDRQLTRKDETLLMFFRRGSGKYFIVVPKAADGAWLNRSIAVEARPMSEVPPPKKKPK